MNVLLDRQAWMHSAKSFLAASLALWIALRFDLPRPYWAMTTAYVVTLPVLGGTRSRGIYRVSGTLLASVAVIIIVPAMIQTPIVMSLAMSLWLSACVFVALLNRGPSSYVFMLAGYTAAFIGFPMVTQPDDIFNLAIGRSEEIIVGALCAVIVGAVVFPSSIQPVIRRRVDDLMRDAALWCVQVLEHKGSPLMLRKRMAGDLSQLDAIIPFAGRDDPRHGDLDEWLLELRARMLGLLPVLASIEDRLGKLSSKVTQRSGLRQLMDDMRGRIAQGALPTLDELRDFRARIAALRPKPSDAPGNAPGNAPGEAFEGDDDLLLDNLLLRLRELAELWYDNRHLRQSIVDGTPPPAPVFSIDLRGSMRMQNRHIDWSMVTFSALATGATLFMYCLLWITIGWSEGAYGAMMTAVATAFFAAQDDPAPNILSFLFWAVMSVLIVGVYLFGIIPAVHDFVPLILVTAPVFLLAGPFTMRPRFLLAGMGVLTNFSSLLSIQNRYIADFSQYVNSSASMIIGILFSVIVTRLFRSVGAEWSARRLIRQGWRRIAESALGHGQNDRNRFMAHMLDLLGLLAPRLAALPPESDIAAVDMLTEVRIGLNIINLRRVRARLPQFNQHNINQLLNGVAAHYHAQARAGHPLPAPPELLDALKTSIARLREFAPGPERDESLIGLIGLYYGLKPEG